MTDSEWTTITRKKPGARRGSRADQGSVLAGPSSRAGLQQHRHAPPLCRYFQSGYCRNGPHCQFSHAAHADRQRSSLSPSSNSPSGSSPGSSPRLAASLAPSSLNAAAASAATTSQVWQASSRQGPHTYASFVRTAPAATIAASPIATTDFSGHFSPLVTSLSSPTAPSASGGSAALGSSAVGCSFLPPALILPDSPARGAGISSQQQQQAPIGTPLSISRASSGEVVPTQPPQHASEPPSSSSDDASGVFFYGSVGVAPPPSSSSSFSCSGFEGKEQQGGGGFSTEEDFSRFLPQSLMADALDVPERSAVPSSQDRKPAFSYSAVVRKGESSSQLSSTDSGAACVTEEAKQMAEWIEALHLDGDDLNGGTEGTWDAFGDEEDYGAMLQHMPSSQRHFSDRQICSFFLLGTCRYGMSCRFYHCFGPTCPNCSAAVSLDPQLQLEHLQSCEETRLWRQEKDAAAHATCAICLESPLAHNRRFGLLTACTHTFCLQCIREWRGQLDQRKETVRVCPICRAQSYFIIPCDRVVTDSERKARVLEQYKQRLRRIPCMHFNQGQGTCPFGSSCFYAHLLPDGTEAPFEPLRKRANADGTVEIMTQVRLSDFLAHV